MLKVNEERLLFDHAELVGKRAEHLAEIEADAREYSAFHGYDEEKTEKFVAFTKELDGGGLSAEDKARLDILESYIEEVEEPVEEAAIDDEASKTDAEAEGGIPSASAYLI